MSLFATSSTLRASFSFAFMPRSSRCLYPPPPGFRRRCSCLHLHSCCLNPRPPVLHPRCRCEHLLSCCSHLPVPGLHPLSFSLHSTPASSATTQSLSPFIRSSSGTNMSLFGFMFSSSPTTESLFPLLCFWFASTQLPLASINITFTSTCCRLHPFFPGLHPLSRCFHPSPTLLHPPSSRFASPPSPSCTRLLYFLYSPSVALNPALTLR